MGCGGHWLCGPMPHPQAGGRSSQVGNDPQLGASLDVRSNGIILEGRQTRLERKHRREALLLNIRRLIGTLQLEAIEVVPKSCKLSSLL